MVTRQHQLIGHGASAAAPPARARAEAMTAAAEGDEVSMSASDRLPAHYRIRIVGHLDAVWSDWFDSLTITQEEDGTTTLAGPLIDQAALYGMLSRLRDLGATLLAVERLPAGGP